MAKRKIPQTLDFVEGLLTLAEKADEMIGSPDTHPRYITTRCGDVKLSEQLPETLKRLGIYQGRVALALLGAELALKFLWEREQESETTVAKSSHTFPDLFKGLSKARRDKIQHRYLKIAPNPKRGGKASARYSNV
jgi:hypothetical protein